MTHVGLVAEDKFRMSVASKIFSKVTTAKLTNIDEIICPCGKCDYHQCGLYVLYGDCEAILYVGQIKPEKDSSLRVRMQEHKRTDAWFGKVRFVRFRPFPYLGQMQLDVAERLLIMSSHQPPYNDKDTSVENLNEYIWDDFMLAQK